MTDTVLVTGAAGLVGRALLRQLTAAGRPVLAIDRVATRISGVDVVAIDLTETHALHALAGRQKLAGILHCGAISGPMVGKEKPFSIVETNIVGTANMLELARIHGVPRFVYCSSASVYGSTGGAPIDAATPPQPSTVYGASKVASEQLVNAYAREHGVSGVSLRLSWIYGPERSTSCILRRMIAAGLADEALDLPFGAGFPRQYIHVEDAAAALIAALDAPALPRTYYDVTGGRIDTLDRVAELVAEQIPGARITLGPGPDPLDDHHGPIDIEAARRDLGYRPAIDLPEGIARFVEAMRAAG
ncbi:NAD-dependent epimerase/dehydratase family protein [Kaistia sp. MMO-174]|uniref:NAD-dependent epimerase/dehydratase family protein n=1 Tax=Kaistia sp. MMO-174 TaxID=3081256 RepID=UPI003018F02A